MTGRAALNDRDSLTVSQRMTSDPAGSGQASDAEAAALFQCSSTGMCDVEKEECDKEGKCICKPGRTGSDCSKGLSSSRSVLKSFCVMML